MNYKNQLCYKFIVVSIFHFTVGLRSRSRMTGFRNQMCPPVGVSVGVHQIKECRLNDEDPTFEMYPPRLITSEHETSDLQGKRCYDLNDGYKIPSVGYGTWQALDADLEKALHKALEIGYRYIDTAYSYGNEHVIGKVLQEWFSTRKLKREDIFILTKLPHFGIRPDGVDKYLKKSLHNLKLNYVDMYLIHMPFGYNDVDQWPPKDASQWPELDLSTDLVATWKAMEAQVDAGRARSIGVSNFNQKQIERILSIARISPANLQVELHVYFQQLELVEFCKKNGIVVTSYSTLGSPGTGGKRNENVPNILQTPKVTEIANNYGKTPAQVVLRFFIQSGIVVIPKSVNEKRVEENFQVFDFQIDDKYMKELKALDMGEKGRIFLAEERLPGAEKHPEYPFPLKKSEKVDDSS